MSDHASVTLLAFGRQHLLKNADEKEYVELLRYLAPVSTAFWTTPGNAPELKDRAAFDDLDFNNGMRAERRLVKGRYRGGCVGYVLREEQELYAAAYMKPREDMSLDEGMMLDLIRQSHGISVGAIKKQTGMLVKHITPIIHKLASRFLVAEDQFADGWDTLWYPFEELYPEQDVFRYTHDEAVAELLYRHAYMNGFITAESARSFYGFGVADIKKGANILLDKNVFVEDRLGGKSGWVLTDDIDELSCRREYPRGVWAFDRSDPLVRANEGFLKGRYTLDDCDPMYYINIDGVFCGAVMGKFNFRDNEHRDVILEIPHEEARERRDEIMNAIYKRINPLVSPLMAFMGEEIMF